MSDLVDAWRMSCEANRFLIDSLEPAWLADAYAPRTRTVGRQFAHLHDVRVRWLNHAAPEHAAGLESFGKDTEPTKARLKSALKKSEAAMARFLESCPERVPSWKGPPATFLGYLVAHEAHHRGLALVALRLAGRKVPKEVVYGLWDWGKRASNR